MENQHESQANQNNTDSSSEASLRHNDSLSKLAMDYFIWAPKDPKDNQLIMNAFKFKVATGFERLT